jgi:hypothetical protein
LTGAAGPPLLIISEADHADRNIVMGDADGLAYHVTKQIVIRNSR